MHGKASRVLKAVGQEYIQVSRVIKLQRDVSWHRRKQPTCKIHTSAIRYRDDTVSFYMTRGNEKRRRIERARD